MIDAVSYLASGILLATLRTPAGEPKPETERPRNLRLEIREGLSWVYRNSTLGPLALTSHLWFVCQGMITTIYILFVLNGLGMSPFLLGVTYALSGIGSVLEATSSGWIGRRFEVGPALIGCKWLSPASYLLIPLAGPGMSGPVLLCIAQFVFGLSIGVDSPIEMGC